MPDRLEILKTHKLYIDGKFPRSESGRSLAVYEGLGVRTDGVTPEPRAAKGRRSPASGPGVRRVLAHVSRASRKDFRESVSAARRALPGWRSITPYLRAQIMYRIAEMLEARREEFIELIRAAGDPSAASPNSSAPPGRSRRSASSRRAGAGSADVSRSAVPPASAEREVHAAVDRLVCFAGWADKFPQVLCCNNPVSGPYYNFTVAEPCGVAALFAPDDAPLLGLVSLIAPAICGGNCVVALAGQRNPLAGVVLGEVLATSDVPPGVVNILTGLREELLEVAAGHRDVDAIVAAGLSEEQAALVRAGAGENLKRVTVRGGSLDSAARTRERRATPGAASAGANGPDWLDEHECHSPWWIESTLEMKTIWHPIGT